MMAVSYKRLWKLLIDRDMKKNDLAEQANLSNYTINKRRLSENVTTKGDKSVLRDQTCDRLVFIMIV